MIVLSELVAITWCRSARGPRVDVAGRLAGYAGAVLQGLARRCSRATIGAAGIDVEQLVASTWCGSAPGRAGRRGRPGRRRRRCCPVGVGQALFQGGDRRRRDRGRAAGGHHLVRICLGASWPRARPGRRRCPAGDGQVQGGDRCRRHRALAGGTHEIVKMFIAEASFTSHSTYP